MPKKTAPARVVQPPDARYYRFGISGLTSGGKTCILAALALPRVAHPNGLTATLLPLPNNASDQLKKGRQWVDQACEALSAGRVPEPNSHTDPLTLRYRFTDGCQREVFIELVDYSGELLDSSLSQSELAEHLRCYLAEVDGFLFIAEHPKSNESAGELASYLLHLRQALGLIRHSAQSNGNTSSAPIALLINKWDRSGPLSLAPNGYEEQTDRLKAFLENDPMPPHAGLLADLTAASKGGCRAFPVSAFGEAIREPGEKEGDYIERPAQVTPELPSFGIVEPFLWLVEQRDRCDADKLESASRRPSLWFDPLSTLRCKGRAKQIAVRMSTTSPEYSRVRRVKKRMITRFGAHAFWVVMFCLIIDLGHDLMTFRKARVAMTDPANQKGWRAYEAWFTNYIEANPLRHLLHRVFILTNDAASAELDLARAARDANAWKSVIACQDKAVQVKLAKKYLDDFPQGNHAPSASQLITEFEIEAERDLLRARLLELASRLNGLTEEVKQAEKNSPPDFKSINEKLPILLRDSQNVAGLGVANEELSKQWKTIVAGVGSLGAKIAGQVAVGAMRKKYYDLVKENKWDEAGNYLAELAPLEFADLRTHFRNSVMPQVKAVALDIVGNGAGWSEALEYVKKFRLPKMRPLLPEKSNELMDGLVNQIKEKGDRWLYNSCTSRGGLLPFIEYRDNAPLGTMRGVVDEWLHFIELRQKRNTYRVGIAKIMWGDKAKDADSGYDQENEITITVGSATVKRTLYHNRVGVYVPGDRRYYSVEVKDILASDQQNVALQLWDVDWPDADDDLGNENFMSSIEGLQDTAKTLKGSDHGPNTVFFWVEALVKDQWVEFKQPDLPSWKSPK